MSSNIEIRKFSKNEADLIYSIARDAWTPIYDHRKDVVDSDIFESLYGDGPMHKAEQVVKWCLENPYDTVVAVYDGEVAGFVTWREVNYKTVELCENAVSPKFHRKGIASKLHNWFLREMKSKGYYYTYVFTGLDPAHEPARNAYLKAGFSMPTELVRLYKKL